MKNSVLLIVAAAHYFLACFAVYQCYNFGNGKTEIHAFKNADYQPIFGESGLNGGAVGMGIIAAALIVSGSLFLSKYFQVK